jgi:hypothetical protein
MRLTPWLTLRQAKEAIRAGRPDEAHRRLDPLLAEGDRRAAKLARDVACGYASQGEQFLRKDSPDAAWPLLILAESLNTGESRVAELRSALTRLSLAEARAALEAGNPLRTVEIASRMRERNARHPDFESLASLAHDWVLAIEMADRGDFLLAQATAERVRPKLGNVPVAGRDRYLAALTDRHERYRVAVSALSDAIDARRWKEASEWAAKVIADAPAHRDARTVQLRAWEQLKNITQDFQAVVAIEPVAEPESPAAAVPKSTGLPKRFLLWIDGVGGYLVCLGARVSFGQATENAPIDVPLLADVARLHAEISRDGEGYLLESSRGTLINGTPASRGLLKPGDRVTLGSTCQFLFHQPMAISPTARLELVSGHRLQIAVDGVLMMAENLILGPAGHAHIVVPWLTQPVLLYRSANGLNVKIPGEFRIDTRAVLNRAPLPLPSAVSTDHFSFAVEAVG